MKDKGIGTPPEGLHIFLKLCIKECNRHQDLRKGTDWTSLVRELTELHGGKPIKLEAALIQGQTLTVGILTLVENR